MIKFNVYDIAEEELMRKEFDINYQSAYHAALEKLTDEQRVFLYESSSKGKTVENAYYHKLEKGLADGTYSKPSEFLEKECGWLFGDIVFDCHKDSLMYAVDNAFKYPFTYGYRRRPFRSSKLSEYTAKIAYIISDYKSMKVKKTLPQILNEEVTAEELAYLHRSGSYHFEYDIVYYINKGNQTVINWLSDILDSGKSSGSTYSALRATFRSDNAELHKKAADLLLAARLQEGLRQAICETCDEGVYEAYATILKCIQEADLIRFSSVKRAVGTWTGIVPEESKDLDRIGKKEIELIVGCLNDEKFRDECINSDDAMKCYTGLWALAVRDVTAATEKINDILDNGNHQQMLTAALFATEINKENLGNIAKKILLTRTDEHDLSALMVGYCISSDGFSWKSFLDENKEKTLKVFFKDRDECEQVYYKLKELLDSMTQKEEEFSPIVFPWLSVKLTRNELIQQLAMTASLLDENDKIEEISPLIKDMTCGPYGGSKWWYLEAVLHDPKNEVQFDTLVSYCADKESYTSEHVFELVGTMTDRLKPKHFEFFETMLRYKKAEVRANVIKMLILQDDDALFESVSRLIADKKEEKRSGALDIIIQLSKDDSRKELFSRCVPLIDTIAKPTSKEQILIDNIRSSINSSNEPELPNYGLFTDDTSYTPEWDKDYVAECRKAFLEYFPNSEISGKKPKNIKNDFIDKLKKLADLIEEHKTDEYSGYGGEVSVLGSASSIYRWYDHARGPIFTELWDEFCEKENITPQLAVRMKMYANMKNDDKIELYGRLYGAEFIEDTAIPYKELVGSVSDYLTDKLCQGSGIHSKFKVALYDYICESVDTDELYLFTKNSWMKTYYYVSGGEIKPVECANAYLLVSHLPCVRGNVTRIDDIKTRFATEIRMAEKTGSYIMIEDMLNDTEKKINKYFRVYYPLPSDIEYINAAYYGVITKEYMYKHFLKENPDLRQTIRTVSNITGGYRELGKQVTNRIRWGRHDAVTALGSLIGNSDRVKNNALTDEDRKKAEFAVGIYETLAAIILESELKRGDTPAEFTDAVMGFQRIYGAERFVKILAALGKDTLDRSSYYFGDSIPRKVTLSHLLGVCMPEESDNAEKLGELLSKTDISEKRLVEAAMYAPQWLDIIQDYLGWEGFRSACYYFIAHMNETTDDMRTAVIAKYTPITTEELRQGAFDINWFREAYNTVGQERFDLIYDSAKYISDGGKHSRARKYADAVMGKMDKAEALKNIEEKRNKDTLMAYGLIPFENDNDIVERYLVFQKFLKESKKFGAQRRASEANAVERAMQNLALNAGYGDTMRLTLRMETRLFDSIRDLTEFNEVGEIKLRLVIDEEGKTSVECIKGDKPLKSIPAKYKKDETVVRISDVKKQLTDQYRRTRSMLEQSMEDRTEFTAQEIAILCGNPVVYPILRDLVWISGRNMGFFKDMTLVDTNGKAVKLKDDSKMIIAHPYDMYSAGNWREFQKYLFDNQRVQTFKQVFRELYVKTDEELERFDTMRYSGYQIQPKQTLGCLKGRRWVADVEDGLQKIFYKENIIATIYAMADWFSPSEIEAPTLEFVQFVDRKTGKPVKIKDIPDVIFSEVMRDVDLAVSVAHAGQVDPETSHSTIEMRKALCEFTLPLFKLDNVTFNNNHALITGKRADYTIHLGSGVVHIQGGPMINILPVHSQHRGKLFLPFADEDPKTSQILTEILFFAEDDKLKDPFILEQIN